MTAEDEANREFQACYQTSYLGRENPRLGKRMEWNWETGKITSDFGEIQRGVPSRIFSELKPCRRRGAAAASTAAAATVTAAAGDYNRHQGLAHVLGAVA